MKKFISLCCFFCFFGFSSILKSSPLELINSLKEEMSPNNQHFLSALIRSEIKKNENKITHLKEQLNVDHGGKMTVELHRKEEIKQKIQNLELQNEALLRKL